MPKRKSRKKTKKTRKTKAKRVKKAKRRPAKAAKRKVARPTASGRAKKKAAKKAVKAKPIGKVVHFYDRICVAIVELKAPLKIGDRVLLKRGSHALKQRVSSMQIEHTPISLAKRGDIIGMKVKKPVKEGAVVLAA